MENQDRDSNGRFKEGHSGFKPVGSENKLTQKAKYYANKFLDALGDAGIERLPDNASAGEILTFLSKLLPKDLNLNHDGELTINIVKRIVNGKDD